MKQVGILFLVAVLLCGSLASCTRMSSTQQGALSGTAIGVGAGLGISALTGGEYIVGALLGGGIGIVAGAIYGYASRNTSPAPSNGQSEW
ncbi:MAG: cell envelope biogenesis protein OmpA [Desulfovibrionaceae bacterium]|nr:cell envelope biogenesis protein OmpA [Desulfovibrionaceae bacterium]MBR5735022.1 cell envelope biogenesis protein OmpA [Desulfovibrionaceae bacterium]